MRDFWEKEGKTLRVCLCCLSLAVSPYQAGGLTKARDPCQAVLDNCTWPECSWETKRDLRKLGLIRNTSPDLLSQSGIRPRCVYACTFLFLFHGHIHTLCILYPRRAAVTLTYLLHHWNGQDPGGRPDWQNNTKPPYGDINSFTWNSFTATFTRYINGTSGQKIYCIDFFTSGFIFCSVKSQLQQRSLYRIWSP